MTRVKTRSQHLLAIPNPTTTGPSNSNGPSKSRPTSSQTCRLSGLRSSRTGSQQISTANDILPTNPEQTNSLWQAVRYHVHRQAMPPKRAKDKGPAGPVPRTRGQKRKQQDLSEDGASESPSKIGS